MVTQEFLTNRENFPHEKLRQLQGSWVAFSKDGRRIVASAESIDQLFEKLGVMGQEACGVVLESIPGPDDDCQLGASEFY